VVNRLIFAHGLESGPIGRKSQAIIDAGYDVVAPDCRGRDLAQRIEILGDAIARESTPPLLVGSSFGGIAGLCAAIVADARDHRVHAILLCAPALVLPAPVASLRPPAPTEIVHGTRDDVIPIEHSRAFAREHAVVLHEVDDDHRLAGAGLSVILATLRRLAG
jgi:pimeloyl-ACP methyl ester carboxylesterase